MVLAGVTFLAAGPLTRLLGAAGTRVASKLASLLLAAIAVMMVRRGVTMIAVGIRDQLAGR